MTKTCYDGITACRPRRYPDGAGIGILFLAVTNASVKEVLNPLLLAIVPTSRVPYIIFFAILAPLALYRGPMNMFGLGSGIAALIIGLGTLNPLAVMAAFLAAERIQCGGDPTNTQNVWTANFCEVDVNTCTKKMRRICGQCPSSASFWARCSTSELFSPPQAVCSGLYAVRCMGGPEYPARLSFHLREMLGPPILISGSARARKAAKKKEKQEVFAL